jgi:hypothetical protein
MSKVTAESATKDNFKLNRAIKTSLFLFSSNSVDDNIYILRQLTNPRFFKKEYRNIKT